MKNKIFIYSKRERWGILSLAMLNLVLLLTSFGYQTKNYQYTSEEIYAFQSLIKADFEKVKSIEIVDSLFVFNPNETNQSDLEKLGFSKRVTNNIINYRKKGGQFYNTKSLLKIYGMDSLFFEKIKEYCVIPDDKSYQKQSLSNSFSQEKKPSKRFRFDPNKATKKELLALGFQNKSVRALIKYRKKGGYFYKTESVKKIFGVSDSFYKSIEPLIQINKAHYALASKAEKSYSKNTNQEKKVAKHGIFDSFYKKLEVNSATIEEWSQLPAIGPFYARNIVKLRQNFGGFYDIKQIKETYRLSDSTFQIIKPYLILNANLIKKLDLQRSSFKEINRHPYISYEQTKLIMNIQRNGQLYSKKDLRETDIFSKNELSKILPYLEFPEADYDE